MSVDFTVIRNGRLCPDDPVPELFRFPGGEWHLQNIPTRDRTLSSSLSTKWAAVVRGADVDDLVAAALLADMAESYGDGFILLLPYLPAARADRGVPLGLRVYLKLICSFSHNTVVLDPHNADAAVRLSATGGFVAAATDLVVAAVAGAKYDAVIAPDKGAVQRASAVAERLGIGFVAASKTRDFDTGRIVSLSLPPLNPAGRYLVVDDICDGGGTFLMLAQQSGVPRENLGLWVTHGVFSGAAPNLRDHYADIYTTDSHPGHSRPGVATHIEPALPALINHLSPR